MFHIWGDKMGEQVTLDSITRLIYNALEKIGDEEDPLSKKIRNLTLC